MLFLFFHLVMQAFLLLAFNSALRLEKQYIKISQVISYSIVDTILDSHSSLGRIRVANLLL